MRCWEALHKNTENSDVVGELFAEANYSNFANFIEAMDCMQLEQDNIPLIADLCMHFHQKSGSYNAQIKILLSALRRGGRIVLMAHQPNIFPSIAVVEPIFVLSEVCRLATDATGIDHVPVFLFVDYDFSSDKRFHKGIIPIDTKPYKQHFKMAIPKDRKKDAMFNIPKPTDLQVHQWMEIVRVSVKRFQAMSRFRISSSSNIEKVLQCVADCHERAETFAEFNEFFLDRIINLHWNLGVLFFAGHSLYFGDNTTLLSVMAKKEQINESFNQALQTMQDEGISVSIKQRNVHEENAWKYRKLCQKRCRSICANRTYETIAECPSDYVFPDVIYDNLLDHFFIGRFGSVGYYKQAEHVVISDHILRHVFRQRPCPKYLVNSRGIDMKKILQRDGVSGEYIEACQDRQCTILFHIACFGFSCTKELIMDRVQKGQFA